MKQNVSEYDFRQAFQDTRPDNFSSGGLTALYDYLIECEESCDCEIDFDMIGLCCEYTEYENLAELQANYPDIKSIENLQDHTSVIMIDSESFIIQVF